METTFYELLDTTAPVVDPLRERLRSTEHTTGPWAPGLQHAGPPSALLTRAVRQLGGLPERALPARLSFDILGPVPVADLVVTARTLRPGRRVALAEASLASATEPGRPLMALRAWLIRQIDPTGPLAGLPAEPTPPAPPRPHPPQRMRRVDGWHPGYIDAIEWDWVEGAFERPGPAVVWTRLRGALVAGEVPNPIDRLVAVADSASGISAAANPKDLLFVNTDLTLHLTRQPQGTAIWIRAETTLDPGGIGRTVGELGDATGALARSAQCLFVEARG